MMLASYIKDLLYRYDCVIVPNFGGFVTNKIGASIENNTIYPPNKQVSFNSQLKQNDGLLTNEFAIANKISFEEANKQIAELVEQWKVSLQTKELSLDGVGTLTQNNENQLFFEPNSQSNFLTESFGLTPITASVIEKAKEEVISIIVEDTTEESKVVALQEERKKSFGFVKYAAAAAVLIAGVIGVNQYQANTQIDTLTSEQNVLEQKIQKATFIIDDQLPTINFNISKETSNHIHIIAGAFQSEVNANKKIKELKSKGFDAQILGKNNWGLTQVSVGSYSTKEEAQEVIDDIRLNASSDAWILVKN